MKKRFLPLSMLLITMVLAQASFVANAAGDQGKYTPRSSSEATFSSFMKSIRANQETGLIDPADLLAGKQAAQMTSKDADMTWNYAGPDNFGGMTRAIVYNADGTVIIGTIGGDIYKTTNGGITFGKIASINDIISCMAVNSNGDIFIGTGDGRDVQSLNGLSNYGYETSFVGNGIYKIAAGSTTAQHLQSTTATADNGWQFVNELTITNGKIYAATTAGVMVSSDNGNSWANKVEGVFRSVKSNNNGDVMAADEKNVYIIKGDEVIEVTSILKANNNPKIIAMSPTDPNYMYIAYLTGSIGSFKTGDIYFTEDGGENWDVAMTANSVYAIFNENAHAEGFMTVYPNNPRKLLIGSDNLWVFEDCTGNGVNSFRPTMISEYDVYEYSSVAWNRYYYLHQGILNIVFNPTTPNTFYVGTNGGVYKGEYYANLYSYKSCNRYFLTEDQHTSPTRMMNVGIGGGDEVLGGCLDHGTLGIAGSEYVNNVTTGLTVFPHQTNNGYASSYFGKDYAGGPCAISTVKPDILFVSGTGNLSTPIYRSETAGEDFDGNFEGESGPIIKNANAFRTPYALWETYSDNHHSFVVKDILETYDNLLESLLIEDTITINDSVFVAQNTIFVITDTTTNMYTELNLNDTLYVTFTDTLHIYEVLHNYLNTTVVDLDTLSLVIKKEAKAGEKAVYYSKQGHYPLQYTLPEPPHDPAHVNPAGGYMWIVGDTIRGLHDPIKTNYVVAVEGSVYMTRDALIFDKLTDWFKISSISGIPSAVTITADGTTAYVGTVSGNFYKITNIDDAFTSEQASVTDTLNVCVEIITDNTTFSGRAITSIAVNPTNNNEVLVTLGNYGNSNYVYVSHDAGATFTASGTSGLPAIPVYSSIIEKSSGLYIIGTEHGIYTSSNGTTWAKSGDFSCPIMDMKQAVMANHDDITDVLYDEAGNETYVVYPGIHNEGMIYAATYGAGVITSGSYKEGADFGVDENDMAGNGVQLNIYPNPVRESANINITLNENANISYQIYDLSGRMVISSELGAYGQGNHTLTINAAELTSGTYIIRVNAGSKTETAKFLVY